MQAAGEAMAAAAAASAAAEFKRVERAVALAADAAAADDGLGLDGGGDGASMEGGEYVIGTRMHAWMANPGLTRRK